MPNHIEIPPEVTRVKQRFSIVGNSRALVEAIERAIKVAPIDLSVLVIGESGAGKEFFPKIIHNFGARKHAKYIAVNCGAIPEPARATSRRLTEVPYSWTRLRNCRLPPRRDCSVCWRAASSLK